MSVYKMTIRKRSKEKEMPIGKKTRCILKPVAWDLAALLGSLPEFPGAFRVLRIPYNWLCVRVA